MSQNTTTYYDRVALRYDRDHSDERNPEHALALERGWPILQSLGVASVADVGCGTGRAMSWLARRDPSLELTGIDPSVNVIEVARGRLPNARFEVGVGERLPLGTGAVDVALASGIMHHVDRPAEVIREMFRVARKAVLISDHNNFAFGGTRARRLRLWLYASGVLGAATFAKQGLRRQGYSEEDGWWYPYSLLNDYGVIASLSDEQYIIPTRPASAPEGNLLLSQSHLAVVAIKARAGWA